MRFAERLAALRKARNLSYGQLAIKTGYSTGHLVAIEKGRTSISLGLLNRLAKAYDLSPAELLLGVDLSEFENDDKQYKPVEYVR